MKLASARKIPRQERARVTVEALLDATARLLVEDGYDKTSTNRIAAKAGVSVGSLYQYYDSKEALVAAVAERHHAEIMGVVATAAAQVVDRDLPVVVEEIVGAMIEAHAMDPKLHRVLSEQIPRDVMTRHIEEDGATFLRSLLEVHRDKLRDDLDLELATFMLIYAVEGVTHAAVLEKPDLLARNGLAREIARMITGYLR